VAPRDGSRGYVGWVGLYLPLYLSAVFIPPASAGEAFWVFSSTREAAETPVWGYVGVCTFYALILFGGVVFFSSRSVPCLMAVRLYSDCLYCFSQVCLNPVYGVCFASRYAPGEGMGLKWLIHPEEASQALSDKKKINSADTRDFRIPSMAHVFFSLRQRNGV